MALTVQSGATVVADADSYQSLALANTYWTDRGSPTTWTGASDATKEAALRFATKWIDQRYRWIGTISSTALNRLKWPRLDAVDVDGREWTGVPQQLKDAVCEVALAHISTSVNEVRDRGGRVKREKVDVIEVEYADGASAGRTWPYVDSLLSELYLGSPSRRQILRS